MERPSSHPPRFQRLSTLGALALLAATTAAGFARVFAGGVPAAKILGAGLASAVVASIFERRGLLLATFASALSLVVLLGLLILPWTTWHGFPTPTTLSVMRDGIGLVGEQARVEVAPAPPLPPLMIAALTAIWVAVFSTHALAFRSGSPFLALMPPATLVAFADTVLDDRFRPGYGVLFLFGALAVVFVDGLRRVGRWGPLWTFGTRKLRISIAALRGAWRVSAGVIVVATFAPVILPGISNHALVDLSGPGGDSVRIDPQVEIASKLTRDDPVPLFRVKTPTPTYYRMLGLDRFDGNAWTADWNAGSAVSSGIPLSPPPAGGTVLDQEFDVVSDLVLPGVPAAYPPIRVSVPSRDLSYDTSLQNVYANGDLSSGTQFTVSSAILRPSPLDLDAVRLDRAQIDPRWTRLPVSTPAEVHALAQQWAGRGTMYRQVLGIQNHLSPTNGFKYDETVEPTDNQYALVDFLTKTKRGFCQQFASAMAVLLRSIGIPARVAVGFTQGTFDSQTDVTTVTSADAHSWVEVWFGNAYGWLAFEPTPRRANPTAFEYYDPARVQCALSGRTCSGAGAVQTTGSPAGGHPSRGANSPTAFLARKEGKIQPGLRPLPPPSPGPPYGALVLAAFGVLLLALLFVPPIRSLRRRLRVRRAVRQPRRLILVTYDVFTERAADIGLGRRAGETVEEYRRRIHAETAVPAGARGSDGAALTDGELDRLSTLVARAAYALDEPAASDAEQAVRCARAVIRDLRRSVGPARRLAGAWRSNR